MTGYGKAQRDSDRYEASAEIKTLNSKFLDVSLRLPRAFLHKEIEVRNLLTEKLQRGKVSLNVEFSGSPELQTRPAINKAAFKAYYQAYQELKTELNDPTEDIFRLAALSPDVVQPNQAEALDETLWQEIRPMIVQALDRCNDFRLQEGAALQKDMEESVADIRQWLEKVKEQLPERDAHMRQRLQSQLAEWEAEAIDRNRFEQELIYYIEKLDVNEELVRLGNHLDYYAEVLVEAESNGKKLNFIAQEIGREINTIGSKANHALIQRYVVGMKEALEKIKEQTMNVL